MPNLNGEAVFPYAFDLLELDAGRGPLAPARNRDRRELHGPKPANL
jgi:hypothetical protein